MPDLPQEIIVTEKKQITEEKASQLARARELASARRKQDADLKKKQKEVEKMEREAKSKELDERMEQLKPPPKPPKKEKTIVYYSSSDDDEPKIEYVRKPKQKVELEDIHSRGFVEDHIRRLKRDHLYKSMFPYG